MDYDARILFIPKEALETNPRASVLGAPLKAGKGMYTQLQNSYIHSEWTMLSVCFCSISCNLNINFVLFF